MRFNLIDRITDCEPGRSLRGVKFLTLAEEYLADHFPSFPVMPGVLMLQALVEASAWLWRLTTEFEHSIIVLREAKNVKYGSFMEPGRALDLSVELIKREGTSAAFRGKGNVRGGAQTVSAQVTLVAYNAREKGPAGQTVDEKLIAHWRERYAWLSGKLTPAQKAPAGTV
jgi:3-hydroxyacyl-[acyl-carrier-protein] dehydratase